MKESKTFASKYLISGVIGLAIGIITMWIALKDGTASEPQSLSPTLPTNQKSSVISGFDEVPLSEKTLDFFKRYDVVAIRLYTRKLETIAANKQGKEQEVCARKNNEGMIIGVGKNPCNKMGASIIENSSLRALIKTTASPGCITELIDGEYIRYDEDTGDPC